MNLYQKHIIVAHSALCGARVACVTLIRQENLMKTITTTEYTYNELEQASKTIETVETTDVKSVGDITVKLNIETPFDGKPIELKYICEAVKEKRERESALAFDAAKEKFKASMYSSVKECSKSMNESMKKLREMRF